MPIFMDRHDVPPEFTAEDMAAAHLRDLENQDKYGVNFRTYWFDHQCSTVFCLIDAPDAATAVQAIASLMAIPVSQPPSFRSILLRLRRSSGGQRIRAKPQKRPNGRCVR